ncbi:MAG: tetratricopeptide repeat protein [Candidatus Flexifilum sp.]
MNPLELIDTLIGAGELNEALALLDTYLTDHPDDDDARRTRIALLRRQPPGGPDDPLAAALDDLARLTALTPADWVEKAIILEARGDLPGAAAAIGSALSLRPFAPDLVERRVDLLLRLGRLAEALNLLDGMILARQPGAWRWRLWRGEIRLRQRQPQDAIAEFTGALEALSARPDQPALIVNYRGQLHLKRAQAYAAAGQYALAQADYAAAADLIPGDATIAFARGMMLWAQGDTAAGQALCAQALADAGSAQRERLRAMLAEEPRWRDLAAALHLD